MCLIWPLLTFVDLQDTIEACTCRIIHIPTLPEVNKQDNVLAFRHTLLKQPLIQLNVKSILFIGLYWHYRHSYIAKHVVSSERESCQMLKKMGPRVLQLTGHRVIHYNCLAIFCMLAHFGLFSRLYRAIQWCQCMYTVSMKSAWKLQLNVDQNHITKRPNSSRIEFVRNCGR